MSDTCNAVVTMAVDTKKYGIRIHKALFRQLGEPRYTAHLVPACAVYVLPQQPVPASMSLYPRLPEGSLLPDISAILRCF